MKADAAPSTINTDIFGLGYVPPTDPNLMDPTSQFQLPLTSGMSPSGTPYDPGMAIPTVDPGTFQTPTPTTDPSITSPDINIPTDPGWSTATQGLTTSAQQQATQEAGQLKSASAPFLSGAQRELSQFESQTLTPTQQQFVDFTSKE